MKSSQENGDSEPKGRASRPDMSEEEYVAYLTWRSQQPDIQALVASWPPLEPDQLAVIARVFGRSRPKRATQSPT